MAKPKQPSAAIARPPALTDIRAQIDAIDVQILALLTERNALSVQAYLAKSHQQQSLRDLGREAELIRALQTLNQHSESTAPLSDEAIEQIFTTIIQHSIATQQQYAERPQFTRIKHESSNPENKASS